MKKFNLLKTNVTAMTALLTSKDITFEITAPKPMCECCVTGRDYCDGLTTSCFPHDKVGILLEDMSGSAFHKLVLEMRAKQEVGELPTE